MRMSDARLDDIEKPSVRACASRPPLLHAERLAASTLAVLSNAAPEPALPRPRTVPTHWMRWVQEPRLGTTLSLRSDSITVPAVPSA
jgi:hypothetical protein